MRFLTRVRWPSSFDDEASWWAMTLAEPCPLRIYETWSV